MGRVTDVGPAALVPAAWLVTLGAHRSLVTERTLLVALAVMDVLLLAFIVASRGAMSGGVLAVWRRVLLAGFAVTAVGTVGVAFDVPALMAFGLYGWIVLPSVAYVQTARAHEDSYRWIYAGSGVVSLCGGGIYALGHLGGVSPGTTVLVGLAAVGVGQSCGIVAAVVQNTRPAGRWVRSG
jgi:hypothetical protein